MKRISKRLAAAAVMVTLVGQVPTFGKEGDGATADPFAAATAAAKDAAAAQSGGANPFRTGTADRYAAAPAGAPASGDARARSDQFLLDARRALSVGDTPRAQQFLSQAQQLKLTYEGPGDSPQKVAESIRECRELAALRNTNGALWKSSYSKFLVKQADLLLSWNDLDTATRAANEASQLNPEYPVGGVTPQDVLRRVAERRKNPSSVTVAAQSPAGGPAADAKTQTLLLLSQARIAMAAGNLPEAQALAGKASALNVPDSQFAPQEDRPARLALDLQKATAEGKAVQLAASALPATSTPAAGDYAQAAAGPDMGPAMRIAQAPDFTPLPLPAEGGVAAEAAPLPNSPATQMLEAGEAALRSGDREGALESFRAAYENRQQLDVLSQQRLQGHMQMLSSNDKEKLPAPGGDLLESAADGQSVAARQLSADIFKRQSEAIKIRETDPNRSLKLLGDARLVVEESELSEDLKSQLLSRLNVAVEGTQKYIEDHKSELELDAANKEILDEIDRDRATKLDVQRRTVEMLDQFNKLVDEHRYAEAEVVANRMYEMAPDDLVAQQVNLQAKMIRRTRLMDEIKAQSEEGAAHSFIDSEQTKAEALANMNVDFGYGADWDDHKNRRSSSEIGAPRSIKSLEIEQKLKTPITVNYDEVALTKVVEGLSQLAGVNIHLDPRGLEMAGVRSDEPVTLKLPQEISLKSALMLILEPLDLAYTIQDEVLKITSEEIRDGEVYQVVYPVGDLVIPIPNFVPTNNMGLQGLINDAYAAMGAYGPGGVGGPMAVVAGNQPGQNGANGPMNKAINAQFNAPAQPGGSTPFSTGPGGPGGLGGAASADFDSLIDLIVSTVEHESWMENGTGEGEIQPFPTNLSLVVSQTQRVHEQIADLLEQLRRLQDLQVTIEVRFIRLTDSFFERIGVDFDFNIRNNSNLTAAAYNGGIPLNQTVTNTAPSNTVGIVPGDVPPPNVNTNYTVDLDLPFRQGSFGLSTPQFGTPVDVGSFGFAILSDIEAFFMINASQGDRRANVLQAPKVTLFNGQQAQVVDAAFRPFVISVIPVVGEFAAAQQPVIVVLSEGTMLSVQAVVSDDRRYVRLTLVPFFSQIGEVQEFTFEGSETTSTSDSESTDNNGTDESSEESEEITRSGTTVQLPTFEVISVSTTVSVPDGGTVLMGGIKRLVEGRNEFGVPLLSKVPYVDRLFRNVGIGRETDSLMMMVTPHIIIQEEEEERLGTVTE